MWLSQKGHGNAVKSLYSLISISLKSHIA